MENFKRNSENDPGTSFKTEVNRHAECGYPIFKFTHGVAENRLEFYVDRDCMKKFGLTDLTDDSTKSSTTHF